MTEYAHRPQPVDYGVTYDDLHLYDNLDSFWLCRLDDGKVIRCLGTRADDKYKEGRRLFGRFIAPRGRSYGNAFTAAFYLLLFGSLATAGKDSRLFGIVLLALGLACFLYAIVPGVVINYKRRHASAGLSAYWQALHMYDQHKAAVETAAREAQREAERRKRSYWEFLDGYEFERATAEVLKRHQFNPTVCRRLSRRWSGYRGHKGGRKGVVQCKAHVGCVGPHIVRDLYGVIHHSGAEFGIIVSRGGFSKGAIDFARNKPIFLVDTSDLIKMQDGVDVLASVFAPS
jgi:hypothetical protein